MDIYRLNDLEKELLMKLQYEFPITPTPIRDVAEALDIDFSEALSVLRRLKDHGVLKRIGFYFNYRAQGYVASLIAFSCRDYGPLAEALKGDPHVTHNFLRDHPVYNVWAVIKRESREELLKYVSRLAEDYNIDRWVSLWSKRTFKLSVKFDLYNGISRSGRYSRVVENPPKPEELGIDPYIPRYVRALKFDEYPYKNLSEATGLGEDEIISLIKEMLGVGILGDPGAALEGRRVGFVENAMVVLEPYDDGYSLCECISELPYSTHVVLRDPYPPDAWRHICYFMVHAVDRSKINGVIDEVRVRCSSKDIMPIYSLMDLKPHVIR
jgi:DNA-binding Lrp family transcriptional regulator